MKAIAHMPSVETPLRWLSWNGGSLPSGLSSTVSFISPNGEVGRLMTETERKA